ncbi:hypothetical protein JCM1840_000601 [Sporobolomyces johnsonii]
MALGNDNGTKRQRATFLEPQRPNLNPPAPDQPDLFQPSLEPSSSRSVAASSSKPREPKEQPSKPLKSVHGNYTNYYTRRHPDPDLPDERLALVPKEWIKGKKVLDVGCNAGAVTIELAQRFEPARVVGVDIDSDLTRKARGNVDLAWSRQAPLKRLLDEATALSSSRKRRSRSRSPATDPPLPPLSSTDPTSPFLPTSAHYFPTSMSRMFGYLPHPKHLLTHYVDQPEIETTGVLRRGKRKVMPLEVKAFPENMRVVHADWVNQEIDADREGYDVIIAFSVTKWIHLTHLNAGLLVFFRRVFDSLLPGGRLVLEPQPFSTYARSAKMSPELRANYELLQEGTQKGWRWEHGEFERVLIELVGFEKRQLLGETGTLGSTFRRPVEVYTKRGGGSWGV